MDRMAGNQNITSIYAAVGSGHYHSNADNDDDDDNSEQQTTNKTIISKLHDNSSMW
jgi:hypothetical protein